MPDLNPRLTIYLFVNDNRIPTPSLLVSELYQQYVDEDGFLYITYTGEDFFG